MGLVRLLLISVLAASLAGCSSASQQTQQRFEYADRQLYQTHYEVASQVHSKRRVLHGQTITAKKSKARHRQDKNSTKIAEPHVVPKMGPPSFTPLADKSNVVATTPSSATKTEDLLSSRLDDESVMKKARSTIAAKMADPNSVEFEDWERALRKSALGDSIDTICGFVRDKSSGPKPFLYVVQKNEAYVGGYTIATSQYRNACSITALPGR